jgi:hypothetical protein
MSSVASGLIVKHARTREQGTLLGISGKGAAQVCLVEFEHGAEEVPKALLRPQWDPFELLSTGTDDSVYPYEGWLRRERFRLLDAFHNDFALGLSNSRVEPQLHQVSVALRALDKSQPRLILADEVGLGKTIEAGLILKELRARMGADLERVLIIVPASLVTQWRFELRSKFNEGYVDMSRAPGQWRDWHIKAALNELVEAARDAFPASPIARLAPLIEGMGSWPNPGNGGVRMREFSWEREWRHIGDLALAPWWNKILWLCPEPEIDEFAEVVGKDRCVDPAWSLERVIGHLMGLEREDMSPFSTR